MNTISCLILDDEPLAVQLLSSHASKMPELDVRYAGSDAFVAMKILKNHPVDLVFIDIQMPQITGIEFMKLFDDRQDFIITSAYQEYALEAFRFRVVDYLVKPISFNRFHQSVGKFLGWKGKTDPSEKENHLIVKAERKLFKIGFADIVLIEGLKDYIRIHTKSEKIMTLGNIKDIVEKLPSGQFLRVHRLFIIPMSEIKIF